MEWSRSEPPALALLEDKHDRVARHTCVGVVSGWLEGYAFWMELTWERLAKPDRTEHSEKHQPSRVCNGWWHPFQAVFEGSAFCFSFADRVLASG